MGKISWAMLCKNPNAIHMIKTHLETDRRSYDYEDIWFYLGQNPNASSLFTQFREKARKSSTISLNPNAIPFLKKNRDIICWELLCKNPNAIPLIEKRKKDEIYWTILSGNPNAIHLLANNLDEIDWRILSANPSIFEEVPEYLLK